MNAKIRFSEDNTKKKCIFSFIVEREYLREKVAKIVRFVVRPSDRREEKSRGEQNKFIYFLFRDASYFEQSSLARTLLYSMVVVFVKNFFFILYNTHK